MGDIVKIGDATLYHGDCLEILPTLDKVDAEAVHKSIENSTQSIVFGGNYYDLPPSSGMVGQEEWSLVTDPPYGMAFQSNYYGPNRSGTGHEKISGDEDSGLLRLACSLRPTHSSYVFGRWENLSEIRKPTSVVTWVKNNHSMGDLQHEHARGTELIFFYAGSCHAWVGKRPHDVIKANRSGNKLHPTEKPIPLMEKIVSLTSGVVVDPFMGSGTTGVACANLGRKFIGIEIERKYFDIACERIEAAYAQGRLFE